MRSNNIKYGNVANGKIIDYLKGLEGFVSIHEIRDNQQNRNSLQGMEKLENDIKASVKDMLEYGVINHIELIQ